MPEAALWLVFLAIVVWAGVKLIALGRDSEKADEAEESGRDIERANRIRDDVMRDNARDRLRDEWER